MLFHVRMTDYPVSRRTPELRNLHWKYLDDHAAHFKTLGDEHYIVRAGVSTDDGTWAGSANLMALPDRASIDRFVAEEPFCKSGLFERVVVERFTFGSQAGHVA
ncbi:MAG: hypothetical protein EXR28_15915 [Betaproteobacteria bacterium]|nr:hypothetical protein [Betaproteobacteria bacterium]